MTGERGERYTTADSRVVGYPGQKVASQLIHTEGLLFRERVIAHPTETEIIDYARTDDPRPSENQAGALQNLIAPRRS
jgi:hypothetical protein